MDTYTHWTFFGQGVILALIQVGGLSLVTLTLFFNLLIRRKLGLRTLQLAQESTSATNFEDAPRLLKGIVGITLAVETVGALLLLPLLCRDTGQKAFLFPFLLPSPRFAMRVLTCWAGKGPTLP